VGFPACSFDCGHTVFCFCLGKLCPGISGADAVKVVLAGGPLGKSGFWSYLVSRGYRSDPDFEMLCFPPQDPARGDCALPSHPVH
jgi:hypothetical protein